MTIISEARDVFPPMKNGSLIGVGLVQKSSPHGIITALEIPSFKALEYQHQEKMAPHKSSSCHKIIIGEFTINELTLNT